MIATQGKDKEPQDLMCQGSSCFGQKRNDYLQQDLNLFHNELNQTELVCISYRGRKKTQIKMCSGSIMDWLRGTKPGNTVSDPIYAGCLSDPQTLGRSRRRWGQPHSHSQSSPQARWVSLEEIPSPYVKCKTQTVFMLEQAANFVTKFHRSIGINVTF